MVVVKDTDTLLNASYDNTDRQRPEKAEEAQARSFRDLSHTLTEEQVKAETSRCLGCGASVVPCIHIAAHEDIRFGRLISQAVRNSAAIRSQRHFCVLQ